MFWICLLVFGLIFSWTLVCAADFYVIPTKKKNYAPVEKTGQTTCYNELGNVIGCLNTGQDGDIQAGVTWPNPRFTDNNNGTVTDNLTGLIWLKNANCDGGKTWADALIYCNALANGTCGLSDGSVAGDWRLPNVKELQSLIDFGNYDSALPSGHPFSGAQSDFYWSSTTNANYTGIAWLVYLYDGHVHHDIKARNVYVWPVRGGQ
jgi:hypothetical protein